jgi:hypothetical protein
MHFQSLNTRYWGKLCDIQYITLQMIIKFEACSLVPHIETKESCESS